MQAAARGPASPPPGAASPEQERENREGREGNAFFLFQFFTQIFLSSPPSLICVKEKNTEGSNDDLMVPTAAWAATGSGGENRRGSRPSPWRPRVSLWRPGAGDHSSEDGARGDRAGACGRARTLESSSSAGRRENGETRTPRGLLEPGQGTPGATCALSTGAPPGRTEIDFKKQAPSLTCSAVCEHFWKIREALKPLTFTLRFPRPQASGALDESGTRGPLASMLGWVLVERRSL